MSKWFLLRRAVGVLFAFLLISGSDAAEPFYQGKTLRVSSLRRPAAAATLSRA